jgi:hypothetical protein
MKKNLYLDPSTYDLVLDGSFNLRVTTTFTEWLSQKLENRLKTFEGEWFANYLIGIPFIGTILVKNPNITQVNAIFKDEILSTEGVKEIIKFEVTFDTSTRKYIISDLQVRSTEGDIVNLGEITV